MNDIAGGEDIVSFSIYFPNPKIPIPKTPLLRADRMGFLDLALLSKQWCQHILESENAGSDPQFINCLI